MPTDGLYFYNRETHRFEGPGLEYGPDSLGWEELQAAYEAGYKASEEKNQRIRTVNNG